MTRRRWGWRGWLLVTGLGGLVAGGLLAWTTAAGRRLDAMRAALDRDEPGWRFADRRAVYEAGLPPDDRNPMTAVRAVADAWRRIDDGYFQLRLDWSGDWLFHPAALNRRPPGAEEDGLLCLCDQYRAVTADARRLPLDPGPAGHRYAFTPDVVGTRTVGTDGVTSAANLLQFDAVMSALTGDADTAVASTRGMLAVGRTLQADPLSPAQRYRAMIAESAADATERVLALSEPTTGLEEWQAELAAEAEYPRLRLQFTARRAELDAIYDYFRSGRETPSAFLTRIGFPPRRDPTEGAHFWLQRDQEHLACLRQHTYLIELTTAPRHEWLALVRDAPPLPAELSIMGRLLFTRHPDSEIAIDLRRTARLRAAAVGVGCERFRRERGRWPAVLSEAAGFLPPVSDDPMTGEPFHYRRTPDGVEILGSVNPAISNQPVGVRLYDPAHRNRPAEEDE